MQLAIIGAGGHGKVVADSAAACGWQISFYDDTKSGLVSGWPVEGNTESVLSRYHSGVFVAIGSNRGRLEWLLRLRDRGVPIATIIDPSAIVSGSARIGEGTFIARGAIVSTDARLGTGCIINTGATVDHDCRLADAVHLSPGVHLSGNVEIGECSWLGTGSSVRNNVSLGRDVIVGVGGVVIRDLASDQTVVGVPVRPLEKS